MDYSPQYPIVERHLSRVKSRRRSAHKGGPGMSPRIRTSTSAGTDPHSGRRRRRTARSAHAAQRPIPARKLWLGLAGMIMVAAIMVVLLGPNQVLQATGLAQMTSSLVALSERAPTP